MGVISGIILGDLRVAARTGKSEICSKYNYFTMCKQKKRDSGGYDAEK